VDFIFNLLMLLISILARLVPELAWPATASVNEQAGRGREETPLWGVVVPMSLLERRPFVPVQNPHLYRVLNQYKPSGTNMVEHLYRAEPRPGTNVPSTRRRGRGHLYRLEVPPGTNDSFYIMQINIYECMQNTSS
jgi:hypothetical protein